MVSDAFKFFLCEASLILPFLSMMLIFKLSPHTYPHFQDKIAHSDFQNFEILKAWININTVQESGKSFMTFANLFKQEF